MKTLLKLLAIATLAIGPAANALEIQVVPRAVGRGVDVIGLHSHARNRSAVILAGSAAATVASAAGLALDTSSQMLVFTGVAVNRLVASSVAVAGTATGLALVTTSAFANRALSLAVNAVRAGSATVSFATRGSVSTATSAGLGMVSLATTTAVTVVRDAGVFALGTGVAILGIGYRAVCGVLGLIGLAC